MKPVFKAFDCADHDRIDAWCPAEGEAVDYWLCLHIGTAEKEGADLFYVHVLSALATEATLGGGKKIVVSEYSWTAVKARVAEILLAADGDDWNIIAKKLSESFDWEFENYVDFKESLTKPPENNARDLT